MFVLTQSDPLRHSSTGTGGGVPIFYEGRDVGTYNIHSECHSFGFDPSLPSHGRPLPQSDLKPDCPLTGSADRGSARGPESTVVSEEPLLRSRGPGRGPATRRRISFNIAGRTQLVGSTKHERRIDPGATLHSDKRVVWGSHSGARRHLRGRTRIRRDPNCHTSGDRWSGGTICDPPPLQFPRGPKTENRRVRRLDTTDTRP